MRRTATLLGAALGMLFLVTSADARQTNTAGTVAGSINVFMDCQTFGCDFDLFRRDIDFVNWVRDRESSDVHVLITSEATGGGGQFYSVAFIGRGQFEGDEAEAEHASAGDATNDERRRGLVGVVAVGLVPYVADSPVARLLSIEYDPADGTNGAPLQDAPIDDPWDSWVLTLSVNGFVNGESSQSFSNLFATIGADRTTDLWKFQLGVNGSRNSNRFELTDRTVRTTLKQWGTQAAVVRSLNPHWSFGARIRTSSAEFLNEDITFRLAPGIEYSIFPYSESSRRQLALQYNVGGNHFRWRGETIFGQTAETRADESLTVRVDFNQQWGQASTGLTGSHYFHDPSKYRVTLNGNINVRLFRGFSVRVFGTYAWIRDQLHIALEDATEEEILLRQRQLATSFRYFTSVGISYRFGSIFNNIVNPRFADPVQGGSFFF